MENRNLFAEIAEGFDALANERTLKQVLHALHSDISKEKLQDVEMQTFMADLEQSLREAQAGIGRVTTPEQIKLRMESKL